MDLFKTLIIDNPDSQTEVGGTWGAIVGTLSNQTDLQSALDAKAPATSGTSILYGDGSGGFSNATVGSGLSFASGTIAASVTSVAGKTGAVTLTSSDVGLGNVTNNAQTQAAVVPNTLPSAGQVLVGNAGGTAYAPVAMSGDASLASTGAITVTKTNGVSFAASATTDTTNANNITSGALALSYGGTGATTQAGAANAVLPSQGSNSGKFLTTDGSNVSWAAVPGGGGATWGSITGTLSNQTDLQSALDGKAPTTSGTSILYGNGSGGFSNATVGSGLSFSSGTLSASVTSVAGQTGAVTLTSSDVGLGNVTNDAQTKAAIVPNTVPTNGQLLIGNGTNYSVSTLSAGTGVTITNTAGGVTIAATGATSVETLVATVTNAEAVAITKGQVVYAFGATGNRMSVKLASNTADATSAKTVGVVSDASIGAGNTGQITLVGVVDGLNLGTFTDGDTLYLGATPGSVTNVKPYAPNHMVFVGIVERANNGNGELYVRIQNGYELDELHNVQIISTPSAGSVLIYDATNALWKAATLTAGTGITITNGNASSSIALTNSSITIAGNSTALGGSVTQDQITGLSSNGIVKRTAANTLATATSGTDYAPATSGTSILYGDGSGGFSNATVGSGLSFSSGTLSASVTSVAGKTGAVTLTSSDVGLGNVTNDAQTKAAIVPNTAPTSGQLLVGNGGGAYAPVSTSGDVTIDSTGATTIGSSKVTNAMLAGSIDLTTKVTNTLPVANGGTGLTNGTSGGVLAFTASGAIASSGVLANNNIVVGGGAGAAPSSVTTGTGVLTALGINTGTAGAFVVNGGALGTPSSGTVTNLTGTASININGTVGATTPNTGAFTTITASSTTDSTTKDTGALVIEGGLGVEKKITTGDTISDASGNVRSIPQNAKTAAYTLVVGDSGKHISITTGGVTVPASVFSAGDAVTIYNNSGSNQTITQGASVTLRQAGTANTGNRTLAQYGVCTVLCVASNTFVISGGGLS